MKGKEKLFDGRMTTNNSQENSVRKTSIFLNIVIITVGYISDIAMKTSSLSLSLHLDEEACNPGSSWKLYCNIL